MSSTIKAHDENSRSGIAIPTFVTSPLVILVIALVAVCLILSLPLSVPIGPMYWDVYIYYDAANRIFSGQVPALDFFAPVGPLGYYLFAGWLSMFPNGQPALMAHWSLLAVSAPLMALVIWDVGSRSRAIALALLVPFLIFALLPFNVREFYPFPGSDAFGVYNRQICQMLYVLMAGIMFARDRRLLTVVITLVMTAMFFLKITGFVAGGIIAAYALLAGRVSLRSALVSSFAFVAILGAIELTTGEVSVYIHDILLLVKMNSGTLVPRLLQSASLNFGILAPTGILALLLLWSDRQGLWKKAANGLGKRNIAEAASFLDSTALWLLVALFAGILFESQNTGSQALIFLWPVILTVLMQVGPLIARPALFVAIVGLAATVTIPSMVAVAEQATRAYVGAAKNIRMTSSNLKTLGNVSMRPEVATRVERMLKIYPEHQDFYNDMALAGELPAPMLYSDFDFQIAYLTITDQAVEAIRKLEAAKGIRFETMGSLNFVNPFPWLMDRTAPLYVSIGADPLRTVPDASAREQEVMRSTDIVLYPTCPSTLANVMLYDMYAASLSGHSRVKLTECYDAFINAKFASALQ
ncbi:MAG: hypothetical protein R3D70_04820 [Rhizobiaceae bacterium]